MNNYSITGSFTSWDLVSGASIVVTILNTANGMWKLIYYKLIKGINLEDIPLDFLVAGAAGASDESVDHEIPHHDGDNDSKRSGVMMVSATDLTCVTSSEEDDNVLLSTWADKEGQQDSSSRKSLTAAGAGVATSNARILDLVREQGARIETLVTLQNAQEIKLKGLQAKAEKQEAEIAALKSQ